MLHSPAVGQTAVANKPDVILVTEVQRKPVKQHHHDNILSRVLFCLVLTDQLFVYAVTCSGCCPSAVCPISRECSMKNTIELLAIYNRNARWE